MPSNENDKLQTITRHELEGTSQADRDKAAVKKYGVKWRTTDSGHKIGISKGGKVTKGNPKMLQKGEPPKGGGSGGGGGAGGGGGGGGAAGGGGGAEKEELPSGGDLHTDHSHAKSLRSIARGHSPLEVHRNLRKDLGVGGGSASLDKVMDSADEMAKGFEKHGKNISSNSKLQGKSISDMSVDELQQTADDYEKDYKQHTSAHRKALESGDEKGANASLFHVARAQAGRMALHRIVKKRAHKAYSELGKHGWSKRDIPDDVKESVDRPNPMGDHGYLRRIIEENDMETRRNPISEFKILAGTRSSLPGLFEGQFIVKGDSRKIGPGNFKGWARDFGDRNQGILVDAPDADAAIKKVCDKKRLNPFYVMAVPADTQSAAKALKLESSKSLQEATDDDIMDAEEEVGDLLGQFDRCKDPQRKAAMLKQAWALMKKSGLDKDRDWMKQYKMRAGKDEEQHVPYKPSGSWAQQHDKAKETSHHAFWRHSASPSTPKPKPGKSLVKRHESVSYLRRSGTAIEESDYDVYRDQKPFEIQIQPPGEKGFGGMSMPGTQGRMTAGDRSLEGAKKMIASFQKMDAKDKYYASKKEFPKYRVVKDGKPVYTTD